MKQAAWLRVDTGQRGPPLHSPRMTAHSPRMQDKYAQSVCDYAFGTMLDNGDLPNHSLTVTGSI